MSRKAFLCTGDRYECRRRRLLQLHRRNVFGKLQPGRTKSVHWSGKPGNGGANRNRPDYWRQQQAQQAQQAELQKSLQQTAPNPIVMAENETKPLPKPDPDDPLDGVPDEKRPTSCYTNTITIIVIRTIIWVNDSHRIDAKSMLKDGKKKSGDIPMGSGTSCCN